MPLTPFISQRSRYLHQVSVVVFTLSTSTLSYADAWQGTTNADWFNAANWSAGLPALNNDVTIDAAGFSPEINSAGAQANNLFIGNTTPNTLTIHSSGELHSANAFIGNTTSGTVNIAGANAIWNNDNSMVVSNAAGTSATLLVANGGVINTGGATIGLQSLSSGTVVLTDAGSMWNVTNLLLVGQNGSGTIVASTGAAIASSSSVIGSDASATGYVSIDGEGTQWVNNGTMIVSDNCTSGELDISNGGLVASRNTIIGNSSGSSGIVSVDGAGTVWNNMDSLIIGNAGSGVVTVADNSTVNVAGRGMITIGSGSVLNIGAAAGNPAGISGAVIATTIHLNGNGSIVFNHSDSNDFFSAAVEGSGSILQSGNGSTVLTGTNSYTGGTVVSNGTLQGTSNSLQGSIIDNSHVIFDQTFQGNFNGTLSGTGDLVKNNTGTVILTGLNTQTGDTTINAGTLQIDAENNLGNGSTLIFGTDTTNLGASRTLATTNSFTIMRSLLFDNDATLSPMNANSVLTVNQLIGTGGMIKAGAGTVVLGQATGYTGNTVIQQGVLRAGVINALPSTPLLQVNSGAEFDTTGLSQNIRYLTNNGLVTIAGKAGFNTLTVTGDLNGSGSMAMATNLVTASSDFLQVLGTTNGQQQLLLANAEQNVDPADTTVIRLVQTNGGGGMFSGYTDAGTWRFAVTQGNGSTLMPNVNAWYLAATNTLSATANAAIGLYSSSFYQFYADMQTLVQRMGELRLAPASGIWFKGYGNRMQINNRASREFDQNTGGFNVGIDKSFSALKAGALSVGFYAGYLYANQNFHQDSSGEVQALSFGVYATWFEPHGWYVDTSAKYSQDWNSFHANTSSQANSHANYSVPGIGGSLEVGKRFALRHHFFIEPQSQLRAGYVADIHYAASNGLLVAGNGQTSVQARLGARSGLTYSLDSKKRLEPYVQASVLQELSGNNHIMTNTHSFTTKLPGTMGQVGAGATFKMLAQAYAYGEYNYTFAAHFHEPIALSAGLRWIW